MVDVLNIKRSLQEKYQVHRAYPTTPPPLLPTSKSITNRSNLDPRILAGDEVGDLAKIAIFAASKIRR